MPYSQQLSLKLRTKKAPRRRKDCGNHIMMDRLHIYHRQYNHAHHMITEAAKRRYRKRHRNRVNNYQHRYYRKHRAQVMAWQKAYHFRKTHSVSPAMAESQVYVPVNHARHQHKQVK